MVTEKSWNLSEQRVDLEKKEAEPVTSWASPEEHLIVIPNT